VDRLDEGISRIGAVVKMLSPKRCAHRGISVMMTQGHLLGASLVSAQGLR
jgi:hypothetical protein